jgi:quercetin dioxygenase-like cupin family protein
MEVNMRANYRRLTVGAAAIGSLLLILIVVTLVPLSGQSQAGRGGGANRLIDNERVSVQRLSAKAGLTEQMHKSPQDIVAIQATPGEIEMQIGDETTKGSPGKVWYLPKTVDHALFNRGTQPVDMIVVNLK